MKKKYFIIVPADTPHGPVKGAYALANSIVELRDVTLVTIKVGKGAQANLHPGVKKICLADQVSGYLNKVRLYRSMLAEGGGRDKVVSISMCFSADLINAVCKDKAIICSSVRGNLLENYRIDYGLIGIPIAITQLLTLRIFDQVVAMTQPMAAQIAAYIGKQPTIIANFIDENMLESLRIEKRTDSVMRFVFVGSLSLRKRPHLVLQAISEMHKMGMMVRLDYIGDGPLLVQIEEEIKKNNLCELVFVHGFQNEPYKMLQEADVMVLPSISEGTSRAVLEALYLGVPCVMRTVDGNTELITENYNGALFSKDNDLPDAMIRAAKLRKKFAVAPPILIPSEWRQKHAATTYIDLLESI